MSMLGERLRDLKWFVMVVVIGLFAIFLTSVVTLSTIIIVTQGHGKAPGI